MSKIQLSDTGIEVIFKMSGGNPGAIVALTEIFKRGNRIDPDDFMQGMSSILLLDTYEIYGSAIYVLYSDICEKNLAKMMAVIRATQLGIFSSYILKDACSRQDYSGKKLIPVDELYEKVKARLPRFDLDSNI